MEFAPAATFLRTRNEEAWVIPYYTNDGLNLFGDRDVDENDFPSGEHSHSHEA